MSLVLDCSVAASFLLKDERHPYSIKVKDTFNEFDIIVPPLFWIELANVFLFRERRKLLEPYESETMLNGMKESNIVSFSDINMDLILQLSRRYQLTSYDASYLALAKQQRAKLATLDEDLKKAAISENLFYNPA